MPLPRNGWVQPVEGVPGGIPIPFTPVAPTPLTVSGQQNLAAAPLSLTTAVGSAWISRWLSLALSAGLVAQQVLTVTVDSALGAAYDVPVEQVTLPIGATSYLFAFPPEFSLAAGDEIKVTLTNTGGLETAVASVVIRGED